MDKTKDYRKQLISCWKRLILFIIAIRTFICRCIFILYGSIAIWNVVIVKSNIYWLLLLTLVPLFIETFIGIQQIKIDKKWNSGVSKWFSPVVLLFLLTACPPIWILELTISSNYTVHGAIPNKSVTVSQTDKQPINQTGLLMNKTSNFTLPFGKTTRFPEILFQNITILNVSTTTATTKSSTRRHTPLKVLDGITSVKMPDLSTNSSTDEPYSELNATELSIPKSGNISDSSSKKSTESPTSSHSSYKTTTETIQIVTEKMVIVPVYSSGDLREALQKGSSIVLEKIESIVSRFDVPSRVTILEQVLLLSLIICRWILPRGGITRDQLSQLLLVNIGMSADILELFEAIKEEKVRHNLLLNIIILIMWQSSLLQFSLTKTVTKARKVRPGFFDDYSHTTKSESKLKLTNCICCQTELWAIATSLFLQDVPFFCLRMTLITRFDVLSYSNIFFTCKNSLVIMLQLFRSYVILVETKPADDKESMASVTAVTLNRWNQFPSNPHIVQSVSLHFKPLIANSDKQPEHNEENNTEKKGFPKASPEVSLSSKE